MGSSSSLSFLGESAEEDEDEDENKFFKLNFVCSRFSSFDNISEKKPNRCTCSLALTTVEMDNCLVHQLSRFLLVVYLQLFELILNVFRERIQSDFAFDCFSANSGP